MPPATGSASVASVSTSLAAPRPARLALPDAATARITARPNAPFAISTATGNGSVSGGISVTRLSAANASSPSVATTARPRRPRQPPLTPLAPFANRSHTRFTSPAASSTRRVCTASAAPSPRSGSSDTVNVAAVAAPSPRPAA